MKKSKSLWQHTTVGCACSEFFPETSLDHKSTENLEEESSWLVGNLGAGSLCDGNTRPTFSYRMRAVAILQMTNQIADMRVVYFSLLTGCLLILNNASGFFSIGAHTTIKISVIFDVYLLARYIVFETWLTGYLVVRG